MKNPGAMPGFFCARFFIILTSYGYLIYKPLQMKTTFSLLTLLWLTCVYAFAQPGIQKNMYSVENGLTKDVMVVQRNPITTASLMERMKVHHVNGLSIAVINNGEVEWAKGYGIKDAGNAADSVTTETLFQLGSVGKIITALAALNLVKEKK
jgi:hypothetical protein